MSKRDKRESPSSMLLRNADDPEGLHSWVELDGWAIDGSGGGYGNPIILKRTDQFYARWQLSDVRERDVGEGTND